MAMNNLDLDKRYRLLSAAQLWAVADEISAVKESC